MSRILLVTNDSWFLVSHRLRIAIRAAASGHQVHVAALEDHTTDQIREAGCTFHPWQVAPRGRSMAGEVRAVLSLATIIRRVKPDVIHLITIKPVLYGGLLARLLRVPAAVYAVNGLGAMFVGDGRRLALLRRFVLRPMYRLAIGHHNSQVIFQNADDRAMLLEQLSLQSLPTTLIRGSGVDLERFTVYPEPDGVPVVFMSARLLRDKGIFEFAEAAERLASQGIAARFQLAGGQVATGNPAALNDADIAQLEAAGRVELLGHQSDMPALLAAANLVVLPSWREGLPKSLLEAAAAGRAVVTTDVPGCRDAIDPDVTGLLVPVRNAARLADAIGELLQNRERRQAMGRAGRELAERAFDVDQVAARHVAIYERLATP